MDKNQAVTNYLLQCPAIQNNPLFFNFADAADENKQLVTVADDKRIQRPFIDGSVLKRYTFTIIDYKAVAYHAVPRTAGRTDENMENLLDTQSIIDWISEQNDRQNFPEFGEDCVVESIEALTEQPNLNGVDVNASPPLAKYSITIQIEYLDRSRRIWN